MENKMVEETTGKKKRKSRKKRTEGDHAKKHEHIKAQASPRRIFGIRYHHRDMFDDESFRRRFCPRSCTESRICPAYSGKFLISMTLSVLLFLIGVSLVLVGYLIPRREVIYEHKNGIKVVTDSSALKFNDMLDDMAVSGAVILSLGGVLFCILLLIPVFLPERFQYTQAPSQDECPVESETVLQNVKEEIEGKSDRKSSADAKSLTAETFDRIPVFAVVHNVQPEDVK